MSKKIFFFVREFLSSIPPIVILIIIIQSGFFLIYRRIDFKNDIIFTEIIKTFLVLGIIFWIISIIIYKWRKTSVLVKIIVTYLYIFLLLYHYHTGANLDFAVLWDYRTELFYTEVLQMIYNVIGINTLLFISAFTFLVILSHVKWKLFSRYTFSKMKVPQIVTLAFLLGLIYIIPVRSQDEITSFSKSFRNWYRINNVFSNVDYKGISEYPYINYADTSVSPARKKILPNIFFIVIESFNAHFVERKTNSRKEITPFFDSLISKGIYIEHFYSNSNLTSKGHLSILFSILPSFRGSVFENFSNINLNSLPKILKSFNYSTIYYQGANSLDFQNEGPFLANNGFDLCKAARSESKKDAASWGMDYPQGGWGGCEDNVLYKQFFETLDSLHNFNNIKKYFGFLATITSHRPWLRQNYDPALPYPHARKIEEDYSNLIFRVDSYLKLFFDELNKREYLNNSLVIITGDHSCPVNEHGTTLNAVNLYDENCKIPLLMLWKDKLFPKRLTGNAWSQVDIAPTILDLLSIHINNHFMGHSFLNDKLITGNLVNLVQPYSGLFFASIIYPYKYVINVCDNEESIYNLYADPGETNNIITGTDRVLLSKLKKEVNQFAINQYLIENNRIWRDSIRNF